MEESIVFPLFKRALKKMLYNGELDKKYSHNKRVKHIKRAIQNAESVFGSMENVPIIPLVLLINDAEVWQNILYYMEIVAHEDDAND